MADQVAEILETVADRFESGQMKWGQGAYKKTGGYDENGHFVEYDEPAYCAVGALRQVVSETADRSTSIWARNVAAWQIANHVAEAVRIRGKEVINPGQFLPEWNDSPERTKEEVVEAFKRAAKDVRNGVSGN